MITVSKSLGATVANGALAFVYADSTGKLTDVYSVDFQIFDADLTEIVALTSATAGRVSPGRYCAVWAPGAIAAGQYFVRWTYKLTSSSPVATLEQEIEVVARPYAGRNYCSVYDLRGEGLTVAQKSDAQAQQLIVEASKIVENLTGLRFLAEYKTIEVNGSGARLLLLGMPIVAIEQIIEAQLGFESTLDLTNLRIANRHLSQGLTDPDDRANPKLEWFDSTPDSEFSSVRLSQIFGHLIWPRGTRNVKITGLFGYTEADGSFTGGTPLLLRKACKLLCFRYAAPMSAGSVTSVGAVIREKTRDQEVEYFNQPKTVGTITGDYEIDSLLASFRRPRAMGAP